MYDCCIQSRSGSSIGSSEEERYLGDQITKDAKHAKTISKRRAKGFGIIADIPGPLPPGRRPLWVHRSEGITDREVLDRLEEELVGQSVTLMYSGVSKEETQEDCGSRGWRCIRRTNMQGAEDGAVVLLDPGVLYTEFITRGRNTLVIVTTQGDWR